jgi:tRNA threonylcarbamoyl adenosine modification protein YeaZ
MRPILAFETSGAHCAAAIYWPNAARAPVLRCEIMAKGQAEYLLPMLEDMLAAQGLVWGDLGAVAVGVGPGNFTVIRISVALARGLSLGLGLAAIGVTGFEACAHGVDVPDYWITIPAPRGQVYAQRCGHAALLLESAPMGADVFSIESLAPQDLVLAIAQCASKRLGQSNPRPAPFYLRPADAAPPSEPAPRILP